MGPIASIVWSNAAAAAPSGVLASVLAVLAFLAWSAVALVGNVVVPPAGDAGGGDPGPGDGGDAGADRGTDDAAGTDRAREDAGADRRVAADGTDDEDDDADLPPEVRDDPKRLRTRFRRLQRQHGQVRPIADRFRGPDGKYMSPEQIDRMRARAADMDEVQEFFDANPDVVQTMVERRRTGGRPAPAADDYQDPYADVSKLPIDTESEAGKWMVEQLRTLHRTNHELRRDARDLKQGLGTVHQRDTARTLAQVEDTWKNETLAVARKEGLTGEDLQDFVTTVYKDFRLHKAEKRLDKANRAAIIQQALRPFKRTRLAVVRRDAAAAHQRADGNGARPQPGNRAAASPARPEDTNRVGTIRDGRKSFFERAGMQPPPGVR